MGLMKQPAARLGTGGLSRLAGGAGSRLPTALPLAGSSVAVEALGLKRTLFAHDAAMRKRLGIETAMNRILKKIIDSIAEV